MNIKRTVNFKLEQQKFFFWYDPAYRADITRTLHPIGRPDLITELFVTHPPHKKPQPSASAKKPSPPTWKKKK